MRPVSKLRNVKFFPSHVGRWCGAGLRFCIVLSPDISLLCVTETTDTGLVHRVVCLFKLKFNESSFLVASWQRPGDMLARMSLTSHEDATRMLAIRPKQVVRVWLMEFREQHDTPQQSAIRLIRQALGKLNWEVARHARDERHPRSIFATMTRVSGVSTRMSRG